jgi:probable rRNA maturation factor
MIILDPDLDPDLAAKATSLKRSAASSSIRASKAIPTAKTASRDVQLPSARALSRFLGVAQAAVRLKGQVTVLLTTDEAIRKLNRQFRGKNKATDVLSFPAEGLGAKGIAGDLAVSVTTALGQAAEQGHSLATEIKVLVLHGLLHLAGYDHEADEGQMAQRERLLRAKLKLPPGLIERAADSKKSPSGAKARGSSGGQNVRAKARTLQSTKGESLSRAIVRKDTSGAKAHADSAGLIVGVKTPTYQSGAAKKAKRT